MSDLPHARLAALADPLAAPADQLPRLRKLLESLLRADYKRRKAPFGNLFQAIGGACYALELAPGLRARLQDLRVAANLVLHESYPGTATEVATGFAAVAELLEALTGEPYAGPTPPAAPDAARLAGPTPLVAPDAAGTPATDPRTVWRVQVLHADLATGVLTVELSTPADGRPPGPFQLVLPEAYESLLLPAAALHPALNLIGPVRLPDGRVRPRRVVLEPDYLISVTTLAECAQRDGTFGELALLKSFLPDETSRSLVVGNLVNRLLDEEVSHAASQLSGNTYQLSAEDLAAGSELAATATETPENGQRKISNEKRTEDFDLEHFLTKKLFRAEPLTLSTLPEFQTRTGVPELLNDLRRHHRTLRQAQRQGFVAGSRSGYQQQPLRLADCFLEPTFLSATYGLQGRLDLLHESPTGYDLVELKSSVKVPVAEPWTNHAAQAQLYRLLLESVFGADGETAGRGRTSILYSNAAEDQPAVRPVLQNLALVDQLLAARNQLVGLELQLARATGPGQTAALLAPMLRPNLAAVPPFNREKAEKTANVWAAADRTERAYCLELTRFAAREMRLALLGDEGRPGDAGGQAGLWLLPQARKHQNFSLLDELELIEDHSNAPDDARDGLGPHLIFQRPAGGREVNFRAGDTLILYPRRVGAGLAPAPASEQAGPDDSQPERATAGGDKPRPYSLSVLDAQVVKVTLAEDLATDGRVVLAVRNRRLAPRYLLGHSHWALEPDTYDTFRREWAGLTSFLSLPPARRRQLLARTAPRPPEGWDAARPTPATAAEAVMARALAAPDWFVLCGPPGTGKTRSVLRELAIRLVADDKNTLLAAYTNRAVDEICEQLIAAGLPFIRIGSRLGTSPAYRPYLLDNMIRDLPTRQMVRARLTNTPLYVGTISSLLGRPELFQLKNFDVAVVDEASQVLEGPMLALLAKAKKFILIGDHRQLPAVVTQEAETSAVAPAVAELLREQLGLTNLRNSYFERLFRRAEARWPYAHGTLANQYRAHADLAALVNDDFYGGQLCSPMPWQHASLNPSAWVPAADAFGEALRRQRLVFVPTRRQPDDFSQKESSQEAELAARAALQVAQGYGPAFDPEATLGIIASYRNQAARIRARLAQLAQAHELPALAQVSVDTVERYQGSQREVIIVSFCCHHEHQLELMVSPDESGQVDRKLNVAVTRARQQLVLLGNELVLQRVPHHAALLERVRAGGGWVG
ncbi:AAA domain-containing protein [Hymenobacter psoromatis]|uniref:AAA domain-containing protein n=1 Tax=Hymenobacter psoromatis TaxID=1484116 RepID=UPI001CBD719C|nr:AAA domain-containing protein [Hymenobacter psoromatis]